MSLSPNDLHPMRHSAAHILASAVLEMFPEAKLGIGPVIENGFYYDFELPRTLIPEDLVLLEQKMRKIIKANIPFVREELPIGDALKLFESIRQPYKKELIEDIGSGALSSDANDARASDAISIYRTGPFVDLCRGPHVATTRQVAADSFKLMRIAGAYWKGSEKNKMLQRIYGVAFAAKQDLEKYLEQIKEAEKRDHRKLGRQLDIFLTSDNVGAGLPLWTPKGTFIRNLLDSYVWELRNANEKFSFQKVTTPHLTSRKLYDQSGHWDKFSDQLFKIKTREEHELVMKPMSCPHHIEIFDRNGDHSYKQLPIRFCETTMVYRDEQTGELGGLARVRSITQDDAHIFCREDQIESEVLNIWKIVKKFYSTFGFDLRVRLSLHDPKHFEKYLGTPETWKTAEEKLRQVVKKTKEKDVTEGIGEAAHYGPKIDFIAKDSIGRDWQIATIQLDLNQPSRFDLKYVDNKEIRMPIVLIHCAIMGSLERFIAVLIEHTAGALPVWLSPTQIAVIPVATRHNTKAKRMAKLFKISGIRVIVDDAKESVGKKIRNAQMQKIPYMIVYGDKEAKSTALFIKERGKQTIKKYTQKAFLEKIKREIEKKKV